MLALDGSQRKGKFSLYMPNLYAIYRYTYQDRTKKMTDKVIKEVMGLNEHFNPQLVEGQKLHVHACMYS